MSEFGDRMKLYEGMETSRHLMPLLPICARIDGKTFHTFCRGLPRPYDERLSRLMVATSRFLLEETGALVAYTQSDEINLVWYSDTLKSQVFLNGKVTKMVSILAGWASAYFTRHLPEFIPERANTIPCFDARVWNTPNQTEAANCILWREMDATRNSVSMAARAHFSHNSLHGQSASVMQERLFSEAGVNWNDYPPFFKRGTFLQKQRVSRPFTDDEIEKLPPKHEARTNPNLAVERWEVRAIDMPPFGWVSNRVEVIFEGADPILTTEETT